MTTKTKKKPVEKPKEDHRSESQAKAQYESIAEMVARLEHGAQCNLCACELDDATIKGGLNIWHKEGHPTHGKPATDEERAQYHNADEARERIQESPLSVEVRSDWHSPGSDDNKPSHYMILLCTGGPACRIVGELNQYGEPDSATIEHQDWFTPWTEYRLTSEEEAVVVEYARCFYFGE